MIDYSGDPLYYTDPNGKQRKAEIFVGVMPYSNFIFCTATSDQTRQSWLLGCKAMLEYFGAVPEYIFLDNSTSLVTRADLYEPQYCAEFKGFAGYYGFSPPAVRPGKPRDKAAVEDVASVELLEPSCLLCLFLRHVDVSLHRRSTEVHCSRNVIDGFVSVSPIEDFADLIFADHG